MLKKIGLFCEQGDRVLINRCLPMNITRAAFSTINPADLKNTILDPRLEMNGGWIPVPNGTMLFIPDRIKAQKDADNNPVALWGEETPFDVMDKLIKTTTLNTQEIEDLVPTCQYNKGLRVPSKINRAFELENGLLVINNEQRAFDRFIARINMKSRNPSDLQTAFAGICNAIKNLVYGKRGLVDNLCGCRMPFSGRAVLIPNPELDIDQAGIPIATLRKWLRKPEFQTATGCKKSEDLKNFWILVGRQPTHDWTNLIGFRIVPVRGNAIHINPAMCHQFDGDHDGDTLHFHLFLDHEARAEVATKCAATAPHVISEFRFGKELKKIAPSSIPTNPNHLNALVKKLFKQSTTGLSINYHDLIRDGKGTGYLDHVDTKQLQAYAYGVSKNGLIGQEQSNGLTFNDAIESYRTIKMGTERYGGLSNSIVELAISVAWNNIHQPEGIALVRTMARIKHQLCQSQLAAKHGVTELKGEDVMRMFQSAMYQFKDNNLNTPEEYFEFMTKTVGLSDEHSLALTNLYFQANPNKININKVLDDLNPTFRITRARTGLDLLDKMLKPHAGFHYAHLFMA